MKSNLDRIGNIASILGITLAIIQLFVKADWYLRIAVFIAVIFLVLLIVYSVQSNSRQKYLNALTEVQNLHYEIIKDQEGFKNFNLDKSVSKLSEYCNRISKILTDLKGDRISMCIKYTNAIGEDYNEMYVKTLCRDFESKKNREKVDADGNIDKISENSDFEDLFVKLLNKKDWQSVFFFANHLPQKHQYNNSHLDKSEVPDEWNSWFSRNKKWPLQYKSTIVVPIISGNNKNIYGYLCADSAKNRGFNKDYDVRLVQDLALDLSQTIKIVSDNHLTSVK